MPKDKELPDDAQRTAATQSLDDTKPNAEIIDFLSTPTFRSKDDGLPADPLTRTRIEVTLDQLRPSEVNPRTTRNPKYEDIKTSIRARGLDHPPNITRVNPADGFYTINDGGNTRLAILEELWQETQEARFYRIECTYVPYEGEFDALVGHMVENDLRGGMLFIEKGLAAVKLCEMLNTESGEDLSMRKLAALITERGWTLHAGDLSRYLYAINTLLPALPTLLWSGAGHDKVRSLRRLETNYRDYWNTQPRPTDHTTFDAVFVAVLSDHDDEILDERGFRQALESAIAEVLGIKPSDVASEVDALAVGLPIGDPLPPDSASPPGRIDNPVGAGVSGKPAAKASTSDALQTPPGPARRPASAPPPERLHHPPMGAPESLAELRQRCCQLARSLAADWGLEALVEPWDHGIGFRIAAPNQPLNEHSPQAGLFLQLVKLDAGAASRDPNTTAGVDIRAMLDKAFRELLLANFADMLWTNTVIIPFTDIPDVDARRFADLRTGYRALEQTAQKLAERYLEENHAA